MSRTRKLKKQRFGTPSKTRFDCMYDKRDATDPFYLVGQMRASAPVKYSRCTVCVGRPHHAPNVRTPANLAWLTCEARDAASTCSWFIDGIHRCCTVPFDDQHSGTPHRCMCRHRWPHVEEGP